MAQQEMSEGQVKALQEKIKNMSPEQLKEFQKQQCIFCQIISKKVASRKIYEDDKCLAIFDINPSNPGHILLMPKEHYGIMPLIPEKELGHMAMVSKALSHVMLNLLKAEGTNIFIANGVAAGQRAQHFMIHIIPRKTGDGLPFDIIEKKFNSADLKSAKEKIQKKVQTLLKVKEIIKVEEEPENNSEDIEEKKKENQEKDKPIKITKEKFITSSTAKRYHKSNCAFAQNITEKKRVYLTEEEAKRSERLPCTCITGKQISHDVHKHKSKKVEKKSVKPKKMIKKEKTGEVGLDDIANLFR